MPFDAHEHGGKERRRLAVDGLKKPGAEDAVIDHIPTEAHTGALAVVDSPAPVAGAEHVEMIGVLVLEQRLGFAIAALLLEVGFDGVAPEMPDLGGGHEADGVAEMLQSPGNVD